MQFVQFVRSHKIFVSVVGFDLLLILILIVISIVKGLDSATINIVVSPHTAIVKVGGQEYQSGAHKIRPGEYNVEISAEGFLSQEFSVDAVKGEITKIYTFLTPEQDNLNYYAKNPMDTEILRQIGSSESVKLYNILNISQELPITKSVRNSDGQLERQVRIEAKNDENCKAYFCLFVRSVTEKNEDLVKEALKERGVDYADYNVEYKVYGS